MVSELGVSGAETLASLGSDPSEFIRGSELTDLRKSKTATWVSDETESLQDALLELLKLNLGRPLIRLRERKENEMIYR